MRRGRRVLEVLAVALVLAGFPAGSSSGQGLDVPAFGGYALSATSAGLALFYDQPSLNAPGSPKPTAELSGARSTATMDSGPSGYALASAAWPGPLVANVPPIVSQESKRPGKVALGPIEFEHEGAPKELTDLPAYPVRAESFHPQGPEQDANAVGGATMEARAREAFADAVSATSTTSLPGVLEAGGLTSFARTELEEALVVSRATATATDVEVLGGLITLDSVQTFARAVSDGRTASVEGTVDVAGLSVDGNPVTIDERGIYLFGVKAADPFTSSINQAMRQHLTQAGITLQLAGPVDIAEGSSASRTLGGLVISFQGGVLRPYVERLPQEARAQLEKYVAFDQTLTIVLAGVTVSSAASPTFPILGEALMLTPGPEVLGATETAAPAPVTSGALPSLGVPGTQPARLPVAGLAARPVGVAGVPAALVGLALAAALAGSRGLRMVAERVLAPGRAESCPLEER